MNVSRGRSILLMVLWLAGGGAANARAQPADSPLDASGIASAVGHAVPLSLPIVTSDGRASTLGHELDPARPAVLTLAYLRCPMLCGLVSRGLADGFRGAHLRVGRDVQMITVSFDPADTPAAARAARDGLCAALGGSTPCEWHVVLAREPAAHTLAARLGFRYAFDAASGTWAHPAVAYVLAPGGRVSAQLTGVSFEPAALRRAIERAARGQRESTLSPVLVRCFAYVPAFRQHAAAILRYKRVGWSGILVAGALALVTLSRRVARRPR